MKTFEEMGLSEDILKSISELGFENPTDIQEKVIPEILSTHRDVIGLAQTGTGKTAGFGLPLIQQIDLTNKAVQAIILCPTRELCMQITKDLTRYSKYTKNLRTLAVYGGSSIDTQVRALNNNPQIVVGTPGRTLDLIKRRRLKLTHISWLVLDEADEMLNMGFRDDLDDILEGTPAERQTLLFSATLPTGVKQITKRYMNDPVEIVSGKKNAGTTDVEHELYVVRAPDRYLALKRLVDVNPQIYAIVFCRTRAETREVADKLIQDGYSADAIHGDLSQAQRDSVMDSFRKRHIQMLVATDVAARGLDINDLTHVLNYNLPDDPEVYIHRSGRTGRAGKHGVSVVISHSREGRRIRELEKIVGQKFKLRSVPSGEEIVEKRLYTLMDKIENIVVDNAQIEPYWEQIKSKLDWIDRDELLKRFVYVEFNKFVDYYKNAKDLNVSQSSQSDGRSGRRGRDTDGRRDRGRDGGRDGRRDSGREGNRDRGRDERRDSGREGSRDRGRDEGRDSGRKYSDKEFTRFFINIGEKQNVKVPNLIGIINENTRRKDIEIGKVDLLRNFSFFEVDSAFSDVILKSFKDVEYEGVELNVEISKPSAERSDNKHYAGKKDNDSYSTKDNDYSNKRRKSRPGARSPRRR
jgi:ATP-dependent RNA helicase DeaD